MQNLKGCNNFESELARGLLSPLSGSEKNLIPTYFKLKKEDADYPERRRMKIGLTRVAPF